MTEEDLRASFK